MSITYVDKKIKDKIKSIVVNEFKGIDLLPENLTELLNYENKISTNAQRILGIRLRKITAS